MASKKTKEPEEQKPQKSQQLILKHTEENRLNATEPHAIGINVVGAFCRNFISGFRF